MSEAVVVDSLDGLRALVEGDGAFLELVQFDEPEGAITLRLILEGVECLDCVMPRDYLEILSLEVLRRTVPDLTRVSIINPRETSSGPT